MEFQPRTLLLRTTSARSLHPPSGVSSALQTPFTLDTEEWIVFSPSAAGDSVLTETHAGSVSSVHQAAPDETADEGGDYTGEEESRVMLPTHDGLGSFLSTGASLSLAESLKAVEDGVEDKNTRIQRWRAQQGEAIMVQIEQESRRLQRRISGLSNTAQQTVEDVEVKIDDEQASLANLPEKPEEEKESFWQRITRSFIRDIIGIDDHLLEVIFGEALPVETLVEETETQNRTNEERILDRIAKELGELVHLYTHPPSTQREVEGRRTFRPPRPRKRRRNASFDSTASSIKFTPTLTLRQQEDAYHAALWGIEEDTESTISARLRQDYWEQDLDLRLVFSYLKTRFAAPRSTAASTPLRSPLYRRASGTSSKHESTYFSKAPAASCASQDRRSKNSSRNYWDIATSVGSGQAGSCVGTGVWAAI